MPILSKHLEEAFLLCSIEAAGHSGAEGAPMGFEIHLQCFRDGETAQYPCAIAEQIFDREAVRPSRLQDVEYADGGAEIYCGRDDRETMSGFMLAHFGGFTICHRLLEISAVTQSAIYWANEHLCLAVTDLSHREHLPADLRRDHYVALVRSVDELWSAIQAEHTPNPG